MTDRATVLARLVKSWRSGGVARPGLLPMDIKHFEERHATTLPDDAWTYFEAVDGMDEGSGDSEMFRFLPLSEVESVGALFETPGTPADHYFVLVDYCIGSHFYAIDLGDGPTRGAVARVFEPDQIQPACPSLIDFLASYLEDSSSLL